MHPLTWSELKQKIHTESDLPEQMQCESICNQLRDELMASVAVAPKEDWLRLAESYRNALLAFPTLVNGTPVVWRCTECQEAGFRRWDTNPQSNNIGFLGDFVDLNWLDERGLDPQAECIVEDAVCPQCMFHDDQARVEELSDGQKSS